MKVNERELQLQKLVSMSDKEQITRLGYELLAEKSALSDPNDNDAVEEGESWLAENLAALRTLFCGVDLLIQADQATGQAKVQIGILIADTVAAHFLFGVPPLTVSAILLRLGRERLCGEAV
jgi:hypothetical protein